MNDASLRHGNDPQHEGGGHDGGGGGGPAGKRTRTEALQGKAEGSTPPPVTVQAQPAEGEPLPTSGQSFVDSIVHGAVDPKKVAAEQLAKGVHDENTITNQVFWACRPEVGHGKLTAGTPEAKEWLRLRDEIVRPAMHAHESHHAAPKAPEVSDGDLANAKAVVPRQDSVGPSGDALIDELLAHVPPNGSPNNVEAAWLLKALDTKLFGASTTTKEQLAQLSHGDTKLLTRENEPAEHFLKRGMANLEKQGIDADRIASGRYAVDAGALPVLGAMVDLAAGRLREFVRGGMKVRRALFEFRDMVRADAGYAKADSASRHTTGNAIDLAFTNGFSKDDDVVAALSGLDPGKIGMVFPDGGFEGVVPHVHLALTDGGKYELGLPFAGQFFSRKHHLKTNKAAAEKDAGPNPAEGTTISTHGLLMWSTGWYESTAVFKSGTWVWTDAWKGSARDRLQSNAMKTLLSRLGAGSALTVSVAAAKEDGVDPKATQPEH